MLACQPFPLRERDCAPREDVRLRGVAPPVATASATAPLLATR